jgi:hypothetical protein
VLFIRDEKFAEGNVLGTRGMHRALWSENLMGKDLSVDGRIRPVFDVGTKK